MDQIINFISNETFLYFLGSVLIGWFVAYRYSLSHTPETTKIKQARRYKKTDFGNKRNVALEAAEEIIETEDFGKLIVRGDGTWEDVDNKHMWIRAPWGMTWNGKSFEGEPIPLNWYDATDMFGKGDYAGTRATSVITEENLAQSAYSNGYKKGRCVVSFAGYSNWRLPTAIEMMTINHTKREKMSDFFKYQEESESMRERLFPGLKTLTKNFLWTANEAPSNCAWAIDGSWPPGDFKLNQKFYILLVRNTK